MKPLVAASAMDRFLMFLFSLTTTMLVCFCLPMLGIVLLLGLLTLAEFSPLAALGQAGLSYTLDVLSVLGSGSVWQGVLTIGLTLSLVGGLFDTYAFYRYQALHH
ncbi:MAG: hypothetical protein AAFR15_00445 [Cyanobacteria bacterium J06627_15]